MTNDDIVQRGTIETRGARFGWVAHGQRTPAVVLGSSRYDERAFPWALVQHEMRVHMLDQRHFATPTGDAPPTELSLDSYAEDTDAIFDALGLREPVILFGHSIHGLLALEYARRRPQRVAGLVIIAAPGKGMFTTMAAAEDAFAARATPERKAAHDASFVRLGGAHLDMSDPDYLWKMNLVNGARYWYDHRFDAMALWDGVKFDAMIAMQLFGMIFGNWSIAQDERRITVPSLVVMGQHDFVAPPELWNDNLGHFDNVEREIFERSAHNPMLEESVHFAATVLTWWKRHR